MGPQPSLGPMKNSLTLFYFVLRLPRPPAGQKAECA